MNIFFFGGSFDPPHKAHKMIYKNCIKLCDKFLFIPSAQTPGKSEPTADGKLRVEMLKTIIDHQDKDKVVIDSYEINSDIKPNYSIDTIKYLKKKYKNSNITMIVGRDQYENINCWYNYEEIIKNVTVMCFNRKPFKLLSSKQTNFIDFDIDISSSEIRKSIAVRQQDKIEHFLTKGTINIINNHNLYNIYDN